MSEAARHRLAGEPEAIYATSWEHLKDELRLLDVRLRSKTIEQRRESNADPLAAFKGLVLSESEILELLDCGEERESPPVDSTASFELELEIQQRRAASLEAGVYLSLPRLAEQFHLSRFEEQCLIICLAPELDSKYEKLFAYLQDDATRRKPSVDLILNLLCRANEEKIAARVTFDPQATLLKCRLVQLIDGRGDGPSTLLSRFLRLDDRIANLLLGFNHIDERLEPFAQVVSPQPEADQLDDGESIYIRMRDFIESHFRDRRAATNLIFYLHGHAARGKRRAAEAVCRELRLPLLVADMERMQSGQPFEEAVWLLGREAALDQAALCLENIDSLLEDKSKPQLKSLFDALRTFSRLTFLIGAQEWHPQDMLRDQAFIPVAFSLPHINESRRLWERALEGREGFDEETDAGDLAGKFRFDSSEICCALAAAENLARWRSPEGWRVTMADISAACRSQSAPRLGSLARKIDPRNSWREIVLPADQLAQLREMCDQARHRHRVYGEWGFESRLTLGKGLNALFSGPPGTGKTMAAEVIASELQLDLYKIDLSQVVSKYIGETEKNLRQIFGEAEMSQAILFFDEADALFGKRSEVKDAHDRYANIEIGYLLQKMEEYEGIAILATNLRENMDEAFVRRMRFIVEFPFPDQQHRRRIWEVIFPDEAPLEDVDMERLARDIKLAGGNIRNIALAAAFYAAADGGRILMPHIEQAARREFQKLGRTWD
ncbi:MAG: ATP-binding protein [Acidobacteriota bacterium]